MKTTESNPVAKNKRRRIALFGVVGVLAIVRLYPYQSELVPTWRIRIVDGSAHPVKDVDVMQVWHHPYSFASERQEGGLLTDANGYVVSPRQTVRASLIDRIVFPVVNKTYLREEDITSACVVLLGYGGKSVCYTPGHGQPLPEQIDISR